MAFSPYASLLSLVEAHRRGTLIIADVVEWEKIPANMQNERLNAILTPSTEDSVEAAKQLAANDQDYTVVNFYVTVKYPKENRNS